MTAKRALYMCRCSVEINFQMIAKLARGIFSCVTRDVLIDPAAILTHARQSRLRPS